MRLSRRVQFAFVLAAATSACDAGDTNHSTPDAGADADAEVDASGPDPNEPAAPIAPSEAHGPDLGDCPQGWRSSVDGDDPSRTHCDPWPEGGPVDCGVDEVHWAGGAGCERVGSACPAGDYAEGLPAGATILYVQDDSPAEGDGTLEQPMSLTDAVQAARTGDILALSKGTFHEVVSLRHGVTLWGACVHDTILAPDPDEDGATVTILGSGGATLTNLTLAGGRPAVSLEGTTLLSTLESVVVRGTAGVGIGVDGAALEAHALVVRDTTGSGLEAVSGAEVTLSRASFERDRKAGIGETDATIVAEDLAIRDSRPVDDGTLGYALAAVAGTVELTRAAFDGNRNSSLILFEGAVLDATDLVVHSTGEAQGLVAIEGSGMTLSRCAILGSQNAGVVQLGGPLQAEDLIVDGTTSDGPRAPAVGIQLENSDSISLARVRIAGTSGVGIVILDGTTADLSDLSVLQTRVVSPAGEVPIGDGMEVGGGARVTMSRVLLEENDSIGLNVRHVGTLVTGTDLVVRSTSRRLADDTGSPEGDLGDGVVVTEGAQVALERVLASGNRVVALGAAGVDSELVLTDFIIEDTESRLTDGRGGIGILITEGASGSLARGTITRSRGAAVVADLGSTIGIEDLSADGTRKEECEVVSCQGIGGGFGLLVNLDSGMTVSRFSIRDNALAGVAVFGAQIDLHQGEVSGHPIGAVVNAEGFDLTRLEDEVLFMDNDRNLDTSTLPVPVIPSLLP